MSVTGFYLFMGRTERMAFRCACGFNYIFGDGESPEITCCNKLYRYEKPRGFWAWLRDDDLPRVKPPEHPVVLRQRAENENQSAEF